MMMNSYCKKHKREFTSQEKCPLCLVEERQMKARRELSARLLANFMPPKRFSRATVKSFVCQNKKQNSVRGQVISYLDGWPQTGGIVMLGSVGTGKTHLAWAICRAVRGMGSDTEMTTVNRIIRDVRSSWQKNTEETEREIIQRFVNVSLLVIDEIGSQYGTDSERIIINEIINDRYEEERPTIVIGNLSVSEMKNILGQRVYDRIIHGGTELFFDWQSYRKKL